MQTILFQMYMVFYTNQTDHTDSDPLTKIPTLYWAHRKFSSSLNLIKSIKSILEVITIYKDADVSMQISEGFFFNIYVLGEEYRSPRTTCKS